MNSALAEVLRHYPAELSRLAWVPLGSGGGFSGATIWRGEQQGHPLFALKAWPIGFEASRLTFIHQQMQTARVSAQLDFVPTVLSSSHRQSFVQTDRLHDITTWMPGVADFASTPTTGDQRDEKLRAACVALAQLHRVWANRNPVTLAPMPAIARRLTILRASTIAPSIGQSSEQSRAVRVLQKWIPPIIAILEPQSLVRVPVFPCLCDLWHDHVLYTGNRVTGFIDYGAMKIDHPAVDLARLLGDLVGDDDRQVTLGLRDRKSVV